MRAKLLVLAASLGALAAVPMMAHHSFGSEYDSKKPLKFENVVVTKVEWTNPHAHFFMDVKDASGKVTNWNLELASPNVLVRNGWKRNSLKEGDMVTVAGSPAKDNSTLAIAQSITLPDGHKLNFLSAFEEDSK